MNGKTTTKVLSGLMAVGLFLCGTLSARAAEEEDKQLKAATEELNREAAASGNETKKAESLAQQFSVDVATVQQMRDKKQGWGEISTQLALAQQLSKKEPGTYPSTAEALSRVETLRDQGKGYGGIANELGFKLGPVVSSVKQSRNAIQTASRANRPETTGGTGIGNNSNKGERPDRLERPEKPERSNRPENAGRPNQ